MSDAFKETLSGVQLATLLGLTPARVTQLAGNGTLVKENGRYALGENVQRYCAAIRKNAGISSVEEVEQGSLDYEHERARFTKAKADKEEVLAAIARGEAINVEDAREAAVRIGAAVAAQIKRLRADLPPMLEGQTPQQMTRTIAGQTDKILAELSRSESKIYQRKRLSNEDADD